eukprot:73753_1
MLLFLKTASLGHVTVSRRSRCWQCCNSTHQIQLVYFLLGTLQACLGRYLSVYLDVLGLSETQIGIIISISFVISIIFQPIIAFISDRLNYRKLYAIFVILCGGITALTLLIPYYVIQLQTNHSNLLVFFLCIIAYNIWQIFASSNISLTDSITLLYLTQTNDEQTYGTYRYFLAVSWGLIHVLFGLFFDFNIQRLEMMPISYFITSILVAISIYFAYHNIHLYEVIERRNANRNTLSIQLIYNIVFMNKQNVLYFMIGLTTGGIRMIIESLLFVVLFNQNPNNKYLYTIFGSSIFVTIIPEIFIFKYGEHITNYLNYKQMLIIGVICQIIRCFMYVYIIDRNKLIILLFVELLHGITFALVQLALVHYVNEQFPKSYCSTAQGIMGMFRDGIGPCLFVSMASVITQYFNDTILYSICGIIDMICLIAFVLFVK